MEYQEIDWRQMEKRDKGENNLHIKDRPREMLLEKGAGALSDAAVLAILLRTGRQGQNAIALAREMIGSFGGLNGLMLITPEGLLGETSL
jgi:DNA repair protein RadC